jgi:NNP family nitrate/nitrite transporter-like MFS transporter
MIIKGNPQQGLFGATMGFFAGFAAVALFGPTASKFNEVMQLSPLMIGFLVAIPSLSGSLLRIPFGAWVDSNGGRKPFLILMWLSLLGMLGLLLVVTYWYPQRMSANMFPVLLLLGVLSGCGIATFSVGIGQVSYWFPQSKQGAALGAYAGLGNLAPGLFSFLLPVALQNWGLQTAYLAWLIFLGAGVALYHWAGLNAPYFQALGQLERERGAAGNLSQNAERALDPAADAATADHESDRTVSQLAMEIAKEHGQQIFPKGNAQQSLVAAARISKTWMLVAIYFTTFGGFIALTAWFPTYWKELYGLGALTAGSLTALYSISASLVRVVGGIVADRLGGERTASLALATTLAGAVLLSLSNQIPMSITGMLLMALGMGVSNAAVFKLMPLYVPQAVGGAAGWIGGLGAFGGFVIPPLMGLVVRQQAVSGYSSGFWIFVGLAAIALTLTWNLQRTRAGR